MLIWRHMFWFMLGSDAHQHEGSQSLGEAGNFPAHILPHLWKDLWEPYIAGPLCAFSESSQCITILHFWSSGRWLWLKKQKAHCFNTALMINLCTLVHWTKKDKSQTDALIYLCGFICKHAAIDKENHLNMHWVHWKKDSKHRDHYPPLALPEKNIIIINIIYWYTPRFSQLLPWVSVAKWPYIKSRFPKYTNSASINWKKLGGHKTEVWNVMGWLAL